jgi:acetyl-CoA synthetase
VTGTHLRDGYGLTEVGMVLADLDDGDGSLTVVPGFDVRLVDAEGDEGLIAVRRPPFQLSTGYLGDATSWDARWRDDLYVTEDLARCVDGRWRFSGRADDVIITSGYNVGPVEVESILLEHPGVEDVAAVAAPDPARGSVVRAVVVRAAGAPAPDELADQLRAIVRERVGRHAYPRIVDYVDELPRTETGKLRRSALR